MTREEAIDCLAVMYERSREGKRVYHNKYQDAFDMAMDALEAQAERTEERTETHACDLIDRQVAIDALDKHLRTTDVPVSYPGIISALTEWLNELPSAQADSKELSGTHKALDTVSRQAAIDAVKFGITYAKAINKSTGEIKELFKEGNKALNEAVERLKELPSAQPERQKGEWIDYAEDGYVECPFCHSATNCDGNKDELHFCFSCGADMRGEQDG